MTTLVHLYKIIRLMIVIFHNFYPHYTLRQGHSLGYRFCGLRLVSLSYGCPISVSWLLSLQVSKHSPSIYSGTRDPDSSLQDWMAESAIMQPKRIVFLCLLVVTLWHWKSAGLAQKFRVSEEPLTLQKSEVEIWIWPKLMVPPYALTGFYEIYRK